MIKFFLHIRQNLLNEGITSNHFKRTIEGIILVVIAAFIPKFKQTNKPFPSLEEIKGWAIP